MTNNSLPHIGFIEKRSSSNDAIEILRVHEARLTDAPKIVDVIADSFTNDPTWSWAFPNLEARKSFWKICIKGAIRYPWVYQTQGYEAVSVWIPPDGSEFTTDDEGNLHNILKGLIGERASEVEELLNRFSNAHPRKEPHYYLSLLGTKTEYRGQGIGMALLKENLVRLDSIRIPAYLESSNPINNQRYESVGFAPAVSFQAPNNGPIITGMWRKANK